MILSPFCEDDERRRSVNGVNAEYFDTALCVSELSTRKTFRNDGTLGDCTVLPSKSGTISFKRLQFSLGFLNGNFVSVPIIKWLASRCESAATI